MSYVWSAMVAGESDAASRAPARSYLVNCWETWAGSPVRVVGSGLRPQSRNLSHAKKSKVDFVPDG
jgi:hypothetical protein